MKRHLLKQLMYFSTNLIEITLGWGSEYFKGPSSRVLQEISITVWDNIRCQKSWNRITNFTMPNTMLCAGGDLGKDACQVRMNFFHFLPLSKKISIFRQCRYNMA